jgi:hypothetical protein
MQAEARDPGGRWQPGHSGNPAGKLPGTRNHATLFAQALFDQDLELLVKTAVDRALKGDPLALKLCIDRILAPQRHTRVAFAMPPLATAEDATRALAAIAAAAAEGELAAAEARDLTGTVSAFLAALAETEFEKRLAVLEADMRREAAMR